MAVKITGIGFAALLVAVMTFGGCSGEYDPNNPAEAESQCEGFVDSRLKAPSTADYDLTAEEQGSGWLVTGTVDSENGFGAKIRSSVRCVLHFVGETAYLDDISVG